MSLRGASEKTICVMPHCRKDAQMSLRSKRSLNGRPPTKVFPPSPPELPTRLRAFMPDKRNRSRLKQSSSGSSVKGTLCRCPFCEVQQLIVLLQDIRRYLHSFLLAIIQWDRENACDPL